MRIATDHLLLRPLEAGDLDAFVAYRRDPAVARLQAWDVGYALEDARELLAEQRGRALGEPGGWLQLAVVRRRDGALVGDCACHVSDDPPRTAEVGVTLARAHQGQGHAREALTALTGVLFERCGLHRVIARADDRNAAVCALLERIGFRREARFVDADWFKGEWTTLRVYALLAAEWPPTRG